MKNWTKNIIRFWSFLKVLNSPFKGLKLVWYWGDIAIGHPYFLPRRTVFSQEKHYLVFKPIKYFGIDYNGLGWKTKFDEYRFEWSPSFSLILFGKQLNITILPNVNNDALAIDCYWEGWLYWKNRTNKALSTEKRLVELFDQYKPIWGNYEKYHNYYYNILKSKFKINIDINFKSFKWL